MKITLLQEDIGNIQADGLILPVDGLICAIGGTAAAKALKSSYSKEAENIEEQVELYTYLEEDVFRLRPLPHGSAVVIDGNDTWAHFIVIASFYHNVNDIVYSPSQSCELLSQAIQNSVREAVKHNLQSIAMTLMGTTYRVTPQQSILALAKGVSSVRAENIEIKWCILRAEDFLYAKNLVKSM